MDKTLDTVLSGKSPDATLICMQCGKATPKRTFARKKRFCSDECRNRWHSNERKAALMAHRLGGGKVE